MPRSPSHRPRCIALLALLSLAGCRDAVAPEEDGYPLASSSAPPTPQPIGPVLAFQRSYSNGNSDIFRLAASGQWLKQLTFGSAADSQPAWSPGGKKLAWARATAGVSQIYVMNPDGSGQTNLSNSSTRDRLPVWSPDGSKILFERRLSTMWWVNWEIYVMNADGSGQTNLSKHIATDQQARWSPTGSQVVFVSHRDGNKEVYRVNADGSEVVNLTQSASEDYQPDWSPDGQTIAFFRYDPLNDGDRVWSYTVFTMHADGSAQAILNDDLANDVELPRWSPNGSKLLLLYKGQNFAVVNPDGSGLVKVATSSNGVGDAAWSPNGGRIAYWSWEPYDNGNDDIQGIRTVGADGSAKQILTNHLYGSGVSDHWPTWAP